MSSQNIVHLIRSNVYDKALDQLYHNYPAFKNSFILSGGKEEDAKDVFQDALVVLIEKIRDRKFELKCSVNTFLFSICRNLSLVYFKKTARQILPELDVHWEYAEDSGITEFMEEERKYAALDQALEKIGQRCKEILSLFYLKKQNMTVIAEALGLKSETSAKTQKYKCLEKAKKMSLSLLEETQMKRL